MFFGAVDGVLLPLNPASAQGFRRIVASESDSKVGG